jgi:hypothetical protein
MGGVLPPIRACKGAALEEDDEVLARGRGPVSTHPRCVKYGSKVGTPVDARRRSTDSRCTAAAGEERYSRERQRRVPAPASVRGWDRMRHIPRPTS